MLWIADRCLRGLLVTTGRAKARGFAVAPVRKVLNVRTEPSVRTKRTCRTG
eukprot:COSAG05_NODE_2640_length_2812_cov_471.011680_1_plen_50_part_10